MRVYYGWWIVAISMLVLMLALGATMNAFGLFVLPVSEDFGLSRADVNTGIILTNLGMAAVAPIVGRMLDIYPTKRIMAVCAVLLAGSLIILGLSHSVLVSAFVLAIPLALGIAGVGTLTSVSLVARWFEAQRGRAMAFTIMGMSFGTVVMAPVVGAMIEAMGWRQSLIILGVLLGIVFLALVPLVRERPGPDDIEPRPRRAAAPAPAASFAPQASVEPLSPLKLLRMPQFWTLAVGTALAMGALQTIMISIVPLAQESGVPVTQSASLLSVLGGMGIVGKLILVWLGDKVDRTLALSLLFCVVAVMSAALMFGDTYVTLLACAAFLGLAAGATMPIFLALLADRVGAASFGAANGTASFLMAVFGAISIRYGGEVYDRTGSYDLMFVSFIAIALLSGLLVFVSGRLVPARPVSVPT